jgi:Amt family ammonium transporter
LNLPQNVNSFEQRQILDALPVLVFLESEGSIVFANAEARQMLGETAQNWTPRPVEDVLWGLLPGTAEPQTLLQGTRSGSPFHATMPAANGRLIPVEGTYSPTGSGQREAIIIAHPGGRERAPKTRLMEDVLSSLPEAVAIEHGGHILYSNPAFTRMFGYTADEAGGGSLRHMIVPETRLNEHFMQLKAVDEQGRAVAETVRTGKSGELLDVSLQISPLLVDGTKVGYVYSFRDIGERRETEARLEHDAMHDVLTGLPNRALFQDRLTLAMSRRARRPEQSCGVIYIDLDHFKELNDALGHAAGDVLLKAVAERLVSALRPHDSAARLGGDEFAILVDTIASTAELETVGRRVLAELSRPYEVFGHMVQSGASIGAALCVPDHTAPEMLIRDADYAMYRAKQAGGSSLEIFDRHLEVCVNNQQERERELRLILDQRLYEFWYEPVYRLMDGTLLGFEATLCWRRPGGEVENFRDLMLVAEETGLSSTLTREMLDLACRQLREWSEQLPRNNFFLSMNLTVRQFQQTDLIAQLNRALAASGADPARLVLEVPESAVNADPDSAVAVLQRMADCGVSVAMDDFGSSLAPLNLLLRLPFGILKLDRKLTVSASAPARQQLLLETLVHFGRSFGLQVVAQGIDAHDQLDTLLQLGCTAGQGLMLSAPLNAAQALALAQLLSGQINRPQ